MIDASVLTAVAHVPVSPCRAPLQQLEARLALRASRPAAETVEDEVQAALAAEAAQLKGVSSQLNARVDAAGQQIAHLNSVSVALLQHISDKQNAMSLEERVALMDGRKIAAVPPSPTVLSVSSWLSCTFLAHIVLACTWDDAIPVVRKAVCAGSPVCLNDMQARVDTLHSSCGRMLCRKMPLD